VSLDAKTLRDMLAQTSFAVSHDETRYALNGVLFQTLLQEDPKLRKTIDGLIQSINL
jgi:DNA polymerase III sliding clamp (beta) subunit (PCNA family)